MSLSIHSRNALQHEVSVCKGKVLRREMDGDEASASRWNARAIAIQWDLDKDKKGTAT